MAWEVTADPVRFDEAASWFLARVVISDVDAQRLDADARMRSFWVGAGLQLAQIQRVFNEINQAIESGEPFEEWRKRVRSELTNDAHAETVFRNAVQRAYNAGRWRQMRESERWRPFGLVDAVLDLATTDYCKTVDGTLLPLDHPWWRTHYFPAHHRCRTSVRSLRRKEAERRGITEDPPELDPQPGFGVLPDDDATWKPDPSKHDADLFAELERKAQEPKPQRKRRPKEHSPAHWARVYAKPTKYAPNGYGKAASTMGWGRAMLERGLDRTPSEVLAELRRLRDAGHPLLEHVDLNVLEGLPDGPIRNTAFAQLPAWRARIALAEHTRTIKPGGFELDELSFPATQGAQRFYELTLDKRVTRPARSIPIVVNGQRAGYSPVRKAINLHSAHDVGTAVHELAHAIEDVHTAAYIRSLAFLRARTQGEQLRRLRDLTGINYEPWEMARPDEFVDAYIGKEYGLLNATEITSMGYELLAGGTPGNHTLSDFARRDDLEMLYFILGQLAGR